MPRSGRFRDRIRVSLPPRDLGGVMACMSAKAAILGTGFGEIRSGADEFKVAHEHFFDGFDTENQHFDL